MILGDSPKPSICLRPPPASIAIPQRPRRPLLDTRTPPTTAPIASPHLQVAFTDPMLAIGVARAMSSPEHDSSRRQRREAPVLAKAWRIHTAPSDNRFALCHRPQPHLPPRAQRHRLIFPSRASAREARASILADYHCRNAMATPRPHRHRLHGLYRHDQRPCSRLEASLRFQKTRSCRRTTPRFPSTARI